MFKNLQDVNSKIIKIYRKVSYVVFLHLINFQLLVLLKKWGKSIYFDKKINATKFKFQSGYSKIYGWHIQLLFSALWWTSARLKILRRWRQFQDARKLLAFKIICVRISYSWFQVSKNFSMREEWWWLQILERTCHKRHLGGGSFIQLFIHIFIQLQSMR